MNSCKNCGGTILFSPKDKGNKCKSCGSIFKIKYDYSFDKNSYHENDIKPRINDLHSKTLRKIKCNSCGANIALGKYDIQSLCPYCGNSEIVDNNKKWIIKIDSIIPFAFSKDEALRQLKDKVKKSFFCNKSIFKAVTNDDITGLYVNSLIFDIISTSGYNGTLSKTKTVKNNDGSTKTETVHFSVRGDIDYNLDNVVIEINSNLDQSEIAKVLPYDYKSAVRFREDFMNGYILEYQDKTVDQAFKDVRKLLDAEVREAIISKHNADSIVNLNLDTKIVDSKYNYSLLPIYFLNIKIKKNNYKLLMNGQTGKMSQLPKSGWKIFGIVASILAVVGLIVAFILL